MDKNTLTYTLANNIEDSLNVNGKLDYQDLLRIISYTLDEYELVYNTSLDQTY